MPQTKIEARSDLASLTQARRGKSSRKAIGKRSLMISLLSISGPRPTENGGENRVLSIELTSETTAMVREFVNFDTGDIWKAADANRDGVAESIGLWASLGAGGSEPTCHPTTSRVY